MHSWSDGSITTAAVIVFTESSRAGPGHLALVLLQQQKCDARVCQVNVTQETASTYHRASVFLLAALELLMRKMQECPADTRIMQIYSVDVGNDCMFMKG